MAIKISENPKIKGIKVLHSEHEISQFVDDTSVILDGSEESLNETFLELEWFKKISGLKINLFIGVKFLLFHCLNSPFIFFKYFS
jgi:hypothetical protein